MHKQLFSARGIPEGCSVALASPSCDEKDSLVRSFLTAGARKGETTFCVTINPTELISLAKECPSNFHLFVCNPRADTIVESLPNVYKLKGTENLTEISITLAKVFRSLNASQTATKRACIEIVSDVLLQHRALQTRRWLKDLIPEFRSEGFTTLATVNPGSFRRTNRYFRKNHNKLYQVRKDQEAGQPEIPRL
jgi:KaiC/GvpD/RAD55 family RecA-like ATPase